MKHAGDARETERTEWWWGDVDAPILAALEGGHIMTTGEIAQKLGVSERAAGSLLAHLALTDQVRILTVAGVPRAVRTRV